MASAADLSGKEIKFTYSTGPAVEVEIISGSVSDQCDVTHYLPVNGSVKRTVAHGRLLTYSFQGAILTSAYPFTALAPGTALSNVVCELNRSAGTPDYHVSADAVVGSMTHTFDTSTHQVFDVVLYADGSYTVPS